jgi:GT2 family glycosyltransferase
LLFSIIIPTFNRVTLLSQALTSVFAQRYRGYEIIVVDDGSTDGTQEYLQALGTRVTAIFQSNQGPGAARNSGAQHAQGEYLAFLDSDDLWFPWTLSCFSELIRRYQSPAILAARLVEFSAESDVETVRETELSAHGFPDYFASYGHNYFVGSGMSVLRRDEFLSRRGYSVEIRCYEDQDLVLRMGEAPGFVQVVEPATLGYRRHSGNINQISRESYEGACYLVRQERRGRYPGGLSRARQRREIITQRTRPAALGLARSGLLFEAWSLYSDTFAWNVVLGRWKYLLGFAVKALLGVISRVRK